MDSLFRFLRVLLPLVLMLTAAITVPLKVFDPKGLERAERLRRDLHALKETNARIKRENETLRQEIRSFHSNPDYMEKVARDELGMVGPDEVIYQFPDIKR